MSKSSAQRAQAEHAARLQWQTAHMTAWVQQERAKGRPEADLTWGNCIRETDVLATDANGRLIIDTSRGNLVPPLNAKLQ